MEDVTSMSPGMTPEEELARREERSRGDRARELLADPLLVEAFDVLSRRFVDEWLASPARDVEGREKLWQLQRLLGSLRAHLGQVVETGRLASLQLDQARRRPLVQTMRELVGWD